MTLLVLNAAASKLGASENGHTPRDHLRVFGFRKDGLARLLEASLPAVKMSADDWMSRLSFNLPTEELRAKLKALQ